MKLILPTFALFLLAGGCSTITLTAALDDGTATSDGTPIVRKRNAGDSNPFSAARGSDGGGEAGGTEEPDHDDGDEGDDDDEPRVIEVRGPLQLIIPRGESRRLILHRTDDGTVIEVAPRQQRAPRIL